MPNELHWINGPWPGRLAVSARPRGGDWLDDEVASWQRSGLNTVLSLLTKAEEKDLGLEKEAADVRGRGMQYLSLPIPDRQVPSSETEVTRTLENLDHTLSSGGHAMIHCRQGIGRTGLIASCLLVMKGFSPGAAIDLVASSRGVPVPETDEQRRWIDRYAALFAPTRS
jgi:protein-tyrosine phosphatase